MTIGKRNRKAFRLFFGLAILLGTALFTGCGKKDAEGPEKPEERNANETVKNDEKTWNGTVSLPDGTNLELVKVEAGSFEMSAKDGENEDNEVPHRVTLTKDFYIGQTEVTQAQWKAVMRSNPSEYKGDDLPVECVSWNDAMEFCEKLNDMGKAPSGWKFSLPTETQWEYAARGGSRSKGYKYSGSNRIGEVAWYGENSGDSWLDEATRDIGDLESHNCRSHAVGQKLPNELGLYDMSGNVGEWCLDDWQRDGSKVIAEFTRGNDEDDTYRSNRGGTWSFLSRFCRVSRRYNNKPDVKYRFIGFRVVLVPEKY